jgi:hypothetical protein
VPAPLDPRLRTGGEVVTGEASPGHHDHTTWRHSATAAGLRLSHNQAVNRLGSQLAGQESRLQIGYRASPTAWDLPSSSSPRGGLTRQSRAERRGAKPTNEASCAPVAPPMSENSGFQRTRVDDGACSRARRAHVENRSTTPDLALRAAGEGFEPSNEHSPVAGFQDRCIQPLCHPAGRPTLAADSPPGRALTRPGDARTLE